MKKLERIAAAFLEHLTMERSHIDEEVLLRDSSYAESYAEYEGLLKKACGKDERLRGTLDDSVFGLGFLKEEAAYKRGYTDALKLQHVIPSVEWHLPMVEDDLGEGDDEEEDISPQENVSPVQTIQEPA